jgi:MFS family permease
VCVAFFMTVLDGTIVTVALPTIKNSLHVSDNTLQWVLIAYTITFGGLLLLGGRAADLPHLEQSGRPRRDQRLDR